MRSVPTFVEIKGQEVKVHHNDSPNKERAKDGADHWFSADLTCAQPLDPFPAPQKKPKESLYDQAYVISPQRCVAYIQALPACLNTAFFPEGKITVIGV